MIGPVGHVARGRDRGAVRSVASAVGRCRAGRRPVGASWRDYAVLGAAAVCGGRGARSRAVRPGQRAGFWKARAQMYLRCTLGGPRRVGPKR